MLIETRRPRGYFYPGTTIRNRKVRRRGCGANSATWTTLTDGTVTYRKVIRDGYLCIDKTLTALGFSGAEDTDWENVKSIKV